jgi:hypothetical protein
VFCPRVLVALAASTALSGCSQTCSPPGSESLLSPGFYRNAADQAVYKLGEDGSSCVIPNEAMMNAYGGFSLVHVTEASPAAFQQGYRVLTGGCTWPVSHGRANK